MRDAQRAGKRGRVITGALPFNLCVKNLESRRCHPLFRIIRLKTPSPRRLRTGPAHAAFEPRATVLL
jgi:hypothetical protein